MQFHVKLVIMNPILFKINYVYMYIMPSYSTTTTNIDSLIWSSCLTVMPPKYTVPLPVFSAADTSIFHCVLMLLHRVEILEENEQDAQELIIELQQRVTWLEARVLALERRAEAMDRRGRPGPY